MPPDTSSLAYAGGFLLAQMCDLCVAAEPESAVDRFRRFQVPGA